jgi:hypothetical protein
MRRRSRIALLGLTLLAPLLCACATTAPAPPPAPAFKTDRDREELKGPVKTVVTESESAEPGEAERRRLGSATYDRAGNLVEDEDVTPDFIKMRTPERLDANTVRFHSKMGDSIARYRYDARGNILREEIWYGAKIAGPADEITEFKYDGNGMETERDFLNPQGKLSGVFHYTRDAAGQIAEEDDWLNDPKSPHAHMLYRYDLDAHGNWTRRSETRSGVPGDNHQFGRSGTLIRTITYYDDVAAAAEAGKPAR